VKWETYNFTDDFQDAILACLIRYPNEFHRFGQIVKPGFFNGPAQVETVLHLIAYHKKYGKYPSLTTLGNFAFAKASRVNVDHANEIVEYVAKLADVDTADLQGVLDLAIDFVKERAIYDGVRKIHAAQSEGKMDKIDPREVIENALRVESYGLPPIKDMATTAKVETPGVLVDGIIHLASKVTIGGTSKASKSFLLMALAVAVATGSKWLGMQCARHKVLYVDLELHEGFLQARQSKIAEAMKVTLEEGWLSYVCLRGETAKASELLPAIAKIAGQEKGLIVLDPLYRVFDAKTNENDMAAMSAILAHSEKICAETGAAFAMATHFAKGDQSKKESIDRLGGSRALAADPDSILTVTALKEDDAYVVEATLRNFPRIPKFAVKWRYPLFELAPDLDPGDVRSAGGSERTYSDHDFLFCLQDEPLTKEAWREIVIKKTSMSKATFNKRIAEYIEKGAVKRSKNGLFSQDL
jgi:hypothetical protein